MQISSKKLHAPHAGQSATTYTTSDVFPDRCASDVLVVCTTNSTNCVAYNELYELCINKIIFASDVFASDVHSCF